MDLGKGVMTVPTVKVEHPDGDDVMIINESDFDPKKHKKVEEKAEKKAEKKADKADKDDKK